MKFWKLSALGNSFLVVPATRAAGAARLPDVERLCDPARGVGADGVVFVEGSRRRLHVYNADGTRAEVSANGARLAAAWWFDFGNSRAREVTWETDAGPVTCRRMAGSDILVTLPPPRFAAESLPARTRKSELWGHALNLRKWGRVAIHALSVGNPQAVVWISQFSPAWPQVGRAIQSHRLFPAGINVVFARGGGRKLEARTFERGVGQTPSSGTGAAAALVAGVRLGHCRRSARVVMPGGTMRVRWRSGGPIEIACAAVPIAAGTFAVPPDIR